MSLVPAQLVPPSHKARPVRCRGPLCAALAVLGLLAAAAPASATFEVDSKRDGDDSNLGDGRCRTAAGDCTLKAAIEEANESKRADTIVFALRDGATIVLADSLDVTEDLRVRGPGRKRLAVSAGADSRVLQIARARVTISGLTLRDGRSPVGGGGIATEGNLTLRRVLVTANTSGGSGGGIANSGELRLERTTVSDNEAHFGGGILNSGRLTLNRSTVARNAASGASFGIGGGIRNTGEGSALIRRSVVRHNLALGDGQDAFGGGIENEAKLRIERSTIAGNTARDSRTANGGGIHSVSGSVRIEDSTISANAASAPFAARGGGISSASGAGGGELEVTASTLSGNTASGFSADGGALYSEAALSITSTTFGAAPAPGATGLALAGDGDATLRNTIVARPAAGGACEFVAEAADLRSRGYNLAGDESCGLDDGVNDQETDLVGADILLGPLAANGGPTETLALRRRSPALDAGKDGLSRDQRGKRRPVDLGRVRNARGGNGADIGAFELGR